MTNFCSTAIETAPPGSVNIPSVLASSLIASLISSLLTFSPYPPDFFTVFTAKIPSPGSPIARLLAIVLGFFTGFISSLFSCIASTIGEHPSGCALLILIFSSLIKPILLNSVNPLCIAHSNAPLPVGTITCSGATHPNCSQTSNASVLEPST